MKVKVKTWQLLNSIEKKMGKSIICDTDARELPKEFILEAEEVKEEDIEDKLVRKIFCRGTSASYESKGTPYCKECGGKNGHMPQCFPKQNEKCNKCGRTSEVVSMKDCPFCTPKHKEECSKSCWEGCSYAAQQNDWMNKPQYASKQKEECEDCKGWMCLQDKGTVKYCSCECHKKQPIDFPEELEMLEGIFSGDMDSFNREKYLVEKVQNIILDHKQLIKYLKAQ